MMTTVQQTQKKRGGGGYFVAITTGDTHEDTNLEGFSFLNFHFHNS